MSNQRNGEQNPTFHDDIIMPEYQFKTMKFHQTKNDLLLTNNSRYCHDMASNDYYLFKYFDYLTYKPNVITLELHLVISWCIIAMY